MEEEALRRARTARTKGALADLEARTVGQLIEAAYAEGWQDGYQYREDLNQCDH